MARGPGAWTCSTATSSLRMSTPSPVSVRRPVSPKILLHGHQRGWSAYRLAMDERERPSASAMSRAPDGRRAIWKLIWGCPAPPKVRVFAWRVVTNSLATWANKASRHLELTDICPLCDVEREDGFHALCRCPLARELWRVMALDWNIPKVEAIVNTGPEWIFSLLDPLDETTRLVVTMWRVWHCPE